MDKLTGYVLIWMYSKLKWMVSWMKWWVYRMNELINEVLNRNDEGVNELVDVWVNEWSDE